ncbi:uncharacterized protein A4U43_C01F23130 [Asparagus officinalis]|uniref:Ubiquitinyl hydrolase variant UBP zinc finger domain-containing protein n=1 Tax=Asparagus officinalis TaxID=4686 RepID=A0A5P1FVS6_ASPOF|nr:uncharacterized protein A4U43_C01F23130 [Asparagus officinalis]
MSSFLAFGKDYVASNYEKTGDPVYLHIQQTKKPIPEIRPLKKPTLLAIGQGLSSGLLFRIEARFPFLDEDVIKSLLELPLWEIAELDEPAGRGAKNRNSSTEPFELSHLCAHCKNISKEIYSSSTYIIQGFPPSPESSGQLLSKSNIG